MSQTKYRVTPMRSGVKYAAVYPRGEAAMERAVTRAMEAHYIKGIEPKQIEVAVMDTFGYTRVEMREVQ